MDYTVLMKVIHPHWIEHIVDVPLRLSTVAARRLMPSRYTSRLKSPAASGIVSIPGRTVLRYSPHTGLWSDVHMEGTDVYIRHSKGPTLVLPDESRRRDKPLDLNSMRSV